MPGGEDPLDREDAEALLEVRRELGSSYEVALVDSFAERIERAVAGRVDAQLAHERSQRALEARAGGRQLALGIVSMVVALPISIVLGVTDNFTALLVVWIGIVLVNMAHALQSRPRD